MNDLSARLWRNLTDSGSRDFLVTPDQRIGYRDIARGIRQWRAMFDAAGLAPGDRFVLRTAQDEVACAAFLAGLVDGVVPVLLEGSCPDNRLRAIVEMVEPGLVLSDNALPELPQPTVTHLLAQRKPGGLRLFGGRRASAEFGLEIDEATRPARQPGDDGLAYLLFTSGTTAAPSGVEITRANLAANLTTLTRLFDYGPEARIFNDMVLAHADGMIQGPVLAAWNGAAVLRAGGFEIGAIEDWLGAVRRLRATHVLTVPTVWSMIDRLAAHDDYFDAPECRMLMTVAAKMPIPLWERIEKRFGRSLINHYGLTETVASALYAGDGPELGARGTVGKPVDCEARIADGAAQGELQLRGANVFHGYWRNPQRTSDSFTQDGWFRTGDLAQMRPDSSYEIIGRVKTAIVTGGVLIHPEEIDDAMLRHSDVSESVTVGLPDELFGEIGVTCVILARPCDETALTEHLRQFVEPRKVSKHIIELPTIPRGLSGKPQLDKVRALATARLTERSTGKQRPDHAQTVLEIAAKVFRVPLSQLTLQTTPRDLAAWDSFTQLNLVLAIEEHFDCRIPAARVSALRALGDFAQAVEHQP
ncbi:AMP-binding protein [Sinirhodobacter sp. HNIBRBA609]|nr:AMP-binding protein [Sinirhodobacter sp. HNIBRBA609]